MKFLEEIAELILRKYTESSGELTLVFPNRRAGLFFQKYISAKVNKPTWSPEIVSIEEFIKNLSNLKSADKFDLIFELYQVFNKLNNSKESFDRFYYWGNIMLQDFDELDKFMVDPELLFKNLAHVKDIENSLDYLEDDQKQLIEDFWSGFGEKLSRHQQGFLGIWDNLFQTYQQFKNRLYEKGLAYNGMIYRDVEGELNLGQTELKVEKVIFAGFNALSKSEEAIISWFVKEGKGEVFWDADDYYLKDNKQEAGRYLREMKFGNQVLRKSFKESYGNAFIGSNKKIELISVASNVGQAQQASEILEELEGWLDENTAVVLPNNELLFPLLHALPECVDKLNITMGYPLAASTIFGFLDALIDLQIRADGKKVYYYRSVLTVLRHPVFTTVKDDQIIEIEKKIVKNNTIWVSERWFLDDHNVLKLIFNRPDSISEYLMEILRFLAQETEDGVEREFLFHFYTLLNRLNEFILNNKLDISKQAFQKLFRQLVQNERLPFEGEPLLGLQVMGILETRNLDFDNVIVLSMNETLLPPAPKNTSFIPYSIRKVFELPVADHQDAMYAYIFYRLVQRAKHIYFINNSTEETGKSAEVSRFVRQLEQETDLDISYRTVSSEVTLEDSRNITIQKNDQVNAKLSRFTADRNYEKRFTPTALTTFLDCSLKFYFKYVLELYEQEEMTEDVDPMVFGNILHKVMERLYLPFDKDGNRMVAKDDVEKLKKEVDSAIEVEFATQFGAEDKHYVFEGQNILAREIIKKMVLKVLEFDQKRSPFELLGVEADEKKGYVMNTKVDVNGNSISIGMKGIIDRIEKKDDTIRIVDYKTGQDEKSFNDIPSLFDQENKRRNKAVFQTLFYGLLYLNVADSNTNNPVQASLFNIRELFKSDFSPLIQFKKSDIPNIRIYFEEFSVHLNALLKEIFDGNSSFVQTEDESKCRYCPYAGICNR